MKLSNYNKLYLILLVSVIIPILYIYKADSLLYDSFGLDVFLTISYTINFINDKNSYRFYFDDEVKSSDKSEYTKESKVVNRDYQIKKFLYDKSVEEGTFKYSKIDSIMKLNKACDYISTKNSSGCKFIITLNYNEIQSFYTNQLYDNVCNASVLILMAFDKVKLIDLTGC